METVTKIRVFCSSPGDVRNEWDVLREVVEDLNSTLGQTLGYEFQLLKWDWHCFPALGRPQGLINDQIGEYDILLGIMWRRFGTLTGVAESGTEEEVNRALSGWLDRGAPQVMFYFCQEPFMPRSSEELEQVRRVLEFKERLSARGLIWEYSDTPDFIRKVRQHLASVMRDLATVTARGKQGELKTAEQALSLPDCDLRARRYVPYYIGIGEPLDPRDLLAHRDCPFTDFSVSADGFVVAILDMPLECTDVLQFLFDRRRTHLAMLSFDSLHSTFLRLLQRNRSSSPLVKDFPEKPAYVMSTHYLNNATGDVAEDTLRVMTEPSALGVTDDPSDTVDERAIRQRAKLESLNVSEVAHIVAPYAHFYVSWANVICALRGPVREPVDLLDRFEVQLQRLWYRLFLYTDRLGHLADRPFKLGREDFQAIRREVVTVKQEYARFMGIEATGSTHCNDLKRELIRTSRIEAVFDHFSRAAALLDDLETLL